MAENRYNVVIIGSGAGGGTMAWELTQSGKRILLIERGDYLKRECENWDSDPVFRMARYQADESWASSSGERFKPGLHYFVGGNTQVYGGVLFRLRDRDCRAHDIDNLYVTDASFFPSIGAVKPTLTIIANALRVADVILARMAR